MVVRHQTCNCALVEVVGLLESSTAAPGLQDQTSRGWLVVRGDASWGSLTRGSGCSLGVSRRRSMIGPGKDVCDRATERNVLDCTFGGDGVWIGLQDDDMVLGDKKE